MLHLIEILLLTFVGLYAGTLIWLIIGLLRRQSVTDCKHVNISVVIAARNERQNIGACLESLLAQIYPPENMEIIVVDDRSEDETAAVVKAVAAKQKKPEIILKQLRNTVPNFAPKKRAIDLGVRSARGDIIFTTDADCRPNPHWIASTVGYFNKKVGMVVGYSPLELPDTKSLGRKILALDSLALAAIAAGSSGWGLTLTCSGRNLAYRKSVFEQVGGFNDIRDFISGDDDLFLHLVRKKTNWAIQYAKTHMAVVPASQVQSLHSFAHQRIRHASKGRHYGGALTVSLVGVYLLNVLVLISMPLTIWGGISLTIALIVVLIKSLFEFILLALMAGKMQRWQLLRAYPLAAILHVPYVVIFGLLGQIVKFHWKGSTFGRSILTTKNR